MSSEPPTKRIKLQHTSSTEDPELELFFDAVESLPSSDRSTNSDESELTQQVKNVPVREIVFTHEQANQKRADHLRYAKEDLETIEHLEGLFLDGCARAENNEALAFEEFRQQLETVDLRELGRYSEENETRTDRLVVLSRIQSGVSTVGHYLIRSRHTTHNFHRHPAEHYRFSYVGEDFEQL